MLTVSCDCVAFEEAKAVLALKCWYFPGCKLCGELGRSVSSIVYISGGFIQCEATNSCSGLDLQVSETCVITVLITLAREEIDIHEDPLIALDKQDREYRLTSRGYRGDQL
jgi:hypothetical protein